MLLRRRWTNAARHLQRWWRLQTARILLLGMQLLAAAHERSRQRKRHAASVAIQRMWVGFRTRAYLRYLRARALVIQALWRGHSSRARTAVLRAKLTAAVRVMQLFVRRYRARRANYFAFCESLVRLKEYRRRLILAAIVAQKNIRRRLGRRVVRKRRLYVRRVTHTAIQVLFAHVILLCCVSFDRKQSVSF